jgi:hypothetical protein
MYGLHQMASPAGFAVKYTDDSIRVELVGGASKQQTADPCRLPDVNSDRDRHAYSDRVVANERRLKLPTLYGASPQLRKAWRRL